MHRAATDVPNDGPKNGCLRSTSPSRTAMPCCAFCVSCWPDVRRELLREKVSHAVWNTVEMQPGYGRVHLWHLRTQKHSVYAG